MQDAWIGQFWYIRLDFCYGRYLWVVNSQKSNSTRGFSSGSLQRQSFTALPARLLPRKPFGLGNGSAFRAGHMANPKPTTIKAVYVWFSLRRVCSDRNPSGTSSTETPILTRPLPSHPHPLSNFPKRILPSINRLSLAAPLEVTIGSYIYSRRKGFVLFQWCN